MTSAKTIIRTDKQTDLHLALAHVVIDCDAQPTPSGRYHSVRASAPARKAQAAAPARWPMLAACSALLTLATAVAQMI